MRLLAFVLCFFVSIGGAGAQSGDSATPLSGVWVPGELLQALQAQAPRQIPCYLVIEPSPLEVLEECGGGRSRWSGAVLEVERAGRLEVRAGEQRRLVFRAGAPNELEMVRSPPGQEPEMVRFYRLPAALEEELRSWAAAQQILVGSWRTEDGAEAEFLAEGTYRLAQEQGAYRLSPGSPVAGAWGVLQLLPEGGQERIYLLAGAGRRLGLALPPAHLVERLRAELAGGAAPDGGGAGGQERGVAPGQERGVAPGQERGAAPGQERGVAPGQERGVAPGQERGVAPGQERGVAPGQGRGVAPGQERGAAPGQERAGAGQERWDAGDDAPGGGAAGGLTGEEVGRTADAPQAAPTLEVALWLERAGPGVEQQATAPSAPEDEPEPAPVTGQEPAPITQPIEPQRRCGCSASEGAAGFGLLVAALALRRRRQHVAPAQTPRAEAEPAQEAGASGEQAQGGRRP